MEPNRIYFKNNPYPIGHKIKEFIWSGRIDEEYNLWFDFHLMTDDYYAEDDSDDNIEPESNWSSKVVWKNYNRCTISSTKWGNYNKGIKLKKNAGKFNFNQFIQNEIKVDQLSIDENYHPEELSFDLYLLGHDSCANHCINIFKNNCKYNIIWKGKIALTYSGDYDFKYEFIANICNVKFDGFHYPTYWTKEKAREVFDNCIEGFGEYKFTDLNPKSNIRQYKIMRKNDICQQQ